MLRQWNARHDRRTRESHLRAHGQRRKQGESFDVGGVELMRPGGAAGPAEEVINCRCRITYVRVAQAAGVPSLPHRVPRDDIEKLDRYIRTVVLQNGRATGWEFVAVYNSVTGNNLGSTTDNEVDTVGFSPEMLGAVSDPNKRFIVYHNHPNSSAPSDDDIVAAIANPGIDKLYALGHDGSTYWIQRENPNWRKVQEAYDLTKNEVTKVLLDASDDGMLPLTEADRHFPHLVNEVLKQHGIIKYEASLSNERASEMESYREIFQEAMRRAGEALVTPSEVERGPRR